MSNSSDTVEDSATRGGGGEARYRLITIVFLVFIGLAALIGILIPAGLGWDFANFYDTGRRAAVWQIADLYEPESLIAGEKPQGTLSFWGAPISALFYAPLSLFSAETALLVFKFQNAAAIFAGLWLLYRNYSSFSAGSDSTGIWRFAALFLGTVLIYQPFWTIYRIGGQTTPTVFLLLAVALFWHSKERFLWSALCFGFAVLIKPAFVFMLLPLCMVSGWKFFREIVAVFITFALASVLILGWDVHAKFLAMMLQGMTKAYPWLYNSSLFVAGENLKLLADPPIGEQIIGLSAIALKILLVFVFGSLFWLSRDENWPSVARRQFNVLMSVTFCLMISQTVWEHYLEIMFLPLTYLTAINQTLSSGARLLLASIFAVSIGQNTILVSFVNAHLSLDTIPELILVGLLKSSPLWLMLAFLLKYRQEFFRSFLDPHWMSLTGKS